MKVFSEKQPKDGEIVLLCGHGKEKHAFWTSVKENDQICSMYVDELVSMGTIAKRFGKSRTWIHKVLRSKGVDTGKRLIEVKCDYCGNTLLKNKSQIRNRQNHFCNSKCYHGSLKDPEFNKYRQGQRVGKVVFLACVGTLDFEPIIHHVDENPENNNPKNLWGFRNQADHFAYHQGGKVMILKANTGKWEEVEKNVRN